MVRKWFRIAGTGVEAALGSGVPNPRFRSGSGVVQEWFGSGSGVAQEWFAMKQVRPSPERAAVGTHPKRV